MCPHGAASWGRGERREADTRGRHDGVPGGLARPHAARPAVDDVVGGIALSAVALPLLAVSAVDLGGSSSLQRERRGPPADDERLPRRAESRTRGIVPAGLAVDACRAAGVRRGHAHRRGMIVRLRSRPTSRNRRAGPAGSGRDHPCRTVRPPADRLGEPPARTAGRVRPGGPARAARGRRPWQHVHRRGGRRRGGHRARGRGTRAPDRARLGRTGARLGDGARPCRGPRGGGRRGGPGPGGPGGRRPVGDPVRLGRRGGGRARPGTGAGGDPARQRRVRGRPAPAVVARGRRVRPRAQLVADAAARHGRRRHRPGRRAGATGAARAGRDARGG